MCTKPFCIFPTIPGSHLFQSSIKNSEQSLDNAIHLQRYFQYICLIIRPSGGHWVELFWKQPDAIYLMRNMSALRRGLCIPLCQCFASFVNVVEADSMQTVMYTLDICTVNGLKHAKLLAWLFEYEQEIQDSRSQIHKC